MNKEEYQKLVKELTPKENRLKNGVIAFASGGLVGFLGEVYVNVLQMCFGFTLEWSYSILCLTLIFLASLFTALGFFDNWVSFCKAGLFLPTTGFAHSLTSASLDYKKDGLITGIGSNVFKLAGSVILYGIVSAFLLSLLGVIING